MSADRNAEVRYSPTAGFTVVNGMTAQGIAVMPPSKERAYTDVTVTIRTFGDVIIEGTRQ